MAVAMPFTIAALIKAWLSVILPPSAMSLSLMAIYNPIIGIISEIGSVLPQCDEVAVES